MKIPVSNNPPTEPGYYIRFMRRILSGQQYSFLHFEEVNYYNEEGTRKLGTEDDWIDNFGPNTLWSEKLEIEHV